MFVGTSKEIHGFPHLLMRFLLPYHSVNRRVHFHGDVRLECRDFISEFTDCIEHRSVVRLSIVMNVMVLVVG